jgi:hypothetical protein
MSWKPEVFVQGQWHRNGLVFATEEEAKHNAYNLFQRWTLTENYRAVEVDEPVNYSWDHDLHKLCPVNQPTGADTK